jgi:hypothetical protein
MDNSIFNGYLDGMEISCLYLGETVTMARFFWASAWSGVVAVAQDANGEVAMARSRLARFVTKSVDCVGLRDQSSHHPHCCKLRQACVFPTYTVPSALVWGFVSPSLSIKPLLFSLSLTLPQTLQNLLLAHPPIYI